jgi:hypothetical protein
LSLIIDGMDQGKSHLPHFVQKSKVYNALLSNNTIFITHYYLTRNTCMQ